MGRKYHGNGSSHCIILLNLHDCKMLSTKPRMATHAGLLGGAVYVNAFTLLSQEIEPEYREFSLVGPSAV